jgi:diguanylate cyclase (GGDEF)-like protein
MVNLTDLPQVWGRERSSVGLSPKAMRDFEAAEIITAQARSRIGVALLVTGIQLALLLGTSHDQAAWRPSLLIEVAFGYTAFTALFALFVRWRGTAARSLVTLALTGDLAFVFATTVAGTTPAHYERALLGAMIVVHMANFYFGRRQAWRTIAIGMGGYLVLVVLAVLRGLPIDLPEELWSLAIGAGGMALVVLQASDVRRRLGTIVSLFERAEEGDFAQAYDVAADARPDAITRVGRAYNRFRSQLASMVLTDPLTGCLNRRGFDQALAREVARATRAGSELALLAIDLDHFKMINDTYGHLVGDEALRATGSLLIQAGRAGDLVGRVGGEEFGVLLADTGATGAFQYASRLCDLMRSHPFPGGPDGTPLTLTASIGVVAGAPDGDLDFGSNLLARADAALYAAKRSGRDRVRVWTPQSNESELGDEALRHPSAR